ncbi:unnamed protein product [Polarella glacialis]|uniref:Transmembrane protein n=1 Tax=Polarella glacialis TaxID=89957 RepID=A0A813JRT3_POLGL|nr:unnamed protein product [Polarella glacialis]
MSRGSVRPYPLDPLEDEFARTPLNTRGNSARDLPGSWLTFAEEGKGAPSDMHAVPRTDDFPNPPQSVHDLAPKWRLVGHGFSAVCILFGIICFCNAFACFSGEARDDIQAERAAKGFCCWRDHPTPHSQLQSTVFVVEYVEAQKVRRLAESSRVSLGSFGSPFHNQILRIFLPDVRLGACSPAERSVHTRGVAAAAHRPGTSLLFVGYREAFCGQPAGAAKDYEEEGLDLQRAEAAEALPLRGSATKLAAPRRVPQLLSAMLFFKWFASVPDMSALQCKACVSRRSSSRGHRRVSISVLLWVELPELAFEDSSSQAERRPTQRTRRALRGLARWLLVPEGRHLVLLVEGGDRREAEAVTAVLVKRGVAPERLPFRLQDGPVQLSVSGESLPVQVGCSAAR